jgi:glucose/arabinose dehydrogenase
VIANAVAVGDAGLLSMTLDPSFATNNYYYVYFARSAGGSSMRDTVARYTATSTWTGTVAGSEFVVWQDDPDANTGHHGATIGFGPDGKLYISTGEHTVGSNAQSLASYRGKVLRINSNGTIPSDNPFVDGSGPNKDEIWAYGLRNPYRFSFDPVTGQMYLGDVGGNDPSTAWEEVDLIVKGANYGWPTCEGPCSVSGVTSPIYAYPHSGRDAAVMGGFIYRGTQFPAEYQGNYFFADYAQNWLKRLTLDPTGKTVTGVFPFWPLSGASDDPTVGDPDELRLGPDGALYYLDLSFDETNAAFNDGTLRRVRYVGGGANHPPSVKASASPMSGIPPLTVSFSSAGTSDADGDALTYLWDFGDLTTSVEANPTHMYTRAGRFAVMLTVSDGKDSSFTTLTIVVGNPPVGVILTPANGSLFRAGQHILISGDATDQEDLVLPDSAFSWTIVFHHLGHVHPGVGPIVGVRSMAFDIPVTGHDFSTSTSYEIILTVTDSDGLQSVTSVTILPDKVNMSFDTVPSGLTLELDAISTATPFTHDDVKGFQHTINAPNQSQGGHQYEFVSWSDGGAQSHGITVPDVDTSYVATFREVVVPPPSGLVAAYSFNEGTGTAAGDASGHGLTGTISGATWTTAGKYGNALSFNGTSSYVNLGNPTALQLTGSMTWSAWIYATANPADDGQIIAKSSGAGWQFKTSPDTGPHTFAVGVSANSSSLTQRYSTTARALNTWYHVAGVYNATARTLDIYVNGVLDDGVLRGTVPASQYNSTQNVNIGRRPSGGFYFQGTIDEVRIYNRALSQSEIQTDMNTPLVP